MLGNPLRAQRVVPGGRMQEFTPGNLYWSPGTGAHVVSGANLVEYLRTGGPAGTLGFPTTDEVPARDGQGRYNDFAGGSVYWSGATDAHVVQGSIRQQWLVLGGPTGPLGYPTTNEVTAPDGAGRLSEFSSGAAVYWSPGTGAHAVTGAIRERWRAVGAERGPLGYPTTDELVTADGTGRYNHFAGTGASSIYWSPATGAHAVYGQIRQRWEALGWELGPLGYPTSDELDVPGGRRNEFSRGGPVYWTPATGAHAVYGAIRQRWAASGWELGRYGYPVTDEYAVRGGRQSRFEGGTITWR